MASEATRMTESTVIGATSARSRNTLFLGVFAASALLAFRALWDFDPDAGVRATVSGIEGWFFSPTGRSPVLIFSVAVVLIWGRFSRLLAAIRTSDANPAAAAALLLPASALHLWSYYAGAPDILVTSLILMILGGGFAVAGAAGARILLLPAGFLILAIPPPAVLINQVIYPLQLITATSTVWILDHWGFVVAQQSDLILTPNRLFQVIESCSGLRSMETLAMSALLYGELFYRHRAQVVILFLSVPVISFVANQVRVLSIVLNPLSEISSVHTAQGIIVLVGGVLALALLDGILRWVLPEPVSSGPRPQVAKSAPLPEKPLAALIALLLTLGAASFFLPRWEPAPREGQTLSDFPLVLRGWKSVPEKVKTQFLGSVKFTETQSRTYSDIESGGTFGLFVGIDERYQRNFSLLSAKTELPGSGWVIVERSEVSPTGVGAAGHRMIARYRGELELIYHWYLKVDSVREEVFRSALALDRSFLRRPGRATVVRISAPILPDGSDFEEVEARLLTFAPLVQQAVIALENGTWNRELRKKLAAPDEA